MTIVFGGPLTAHRRIVRTTFDESLTVRVGRELSEVADERRYVSVNGKRSRGSATVEGPRDAHRLGGCR